MSRGRIYGFFWLIFTGLGVGPLWAQPVPMATLTGRITSAADGQPLPFASVYINGTMKGTLTNENGQFTLPNVPFGENKLVVSYTGFAAVQQPLRVAEVRPRPLALALSPLANQLADVVVTARKDKDWQRQLDQFKRDLLGTSSLAAQCRLLNPEVLDFSETGGLLTATAREPLRIENQALGFQLTYTLIAFRSYSRNERVVFGGTTLFKELSTDSPKTRKNWQRNRQVAYLGSLRHLLASLAAGTYEKEGFRVYHTNPTVPVSRVPPPTLDNEMGHHLRPFDARTAVAPGALPHERWLVSQTPIEVLYTRIGSSGSPYRDAPFAFSELILPQQSIGFTTTGQITAPRGFDAVGYLSNDRLAVALPNDWQRDSDAGLPSPPATRPDSAVTPPRPAADITLDTLVRRWQRQAVRSRQTVFVHLDKPLYLTGDHIGLSGYWLDGESQRLDTAQAGPALNVELLTENGTLVQHQWLPVVRGRAAGAFPLADTLTAGTYWLRAYTEADWQRGQVPFERPLWIVPASREGTTRPADPPASFPKESLVPRYAFVEEAPGAPYRTSVVIDSTSLTLTLEARSARRWPTVFALVSARGNLVHTAAIPVRGATTTVRWPVAHWPVGVARLTLMDSTGRVWAKRIVNVGRENQTVTARLRRETPDAGAPDVLVLTLRDEAGRPLRASVSVAVTNVAQTPVDSLAPSLATHLLTLDQRTAGLSTAVSVSPRPGITLHGMVTTAEKQPVTVTVVTASRLEWQTQTTQTTPDGRFQVAQLTLADTARVLVQVSNRRGKPLDATVVLEPRENRFGVLPYWASTAWLLRQWQPLIETARRHPVAPARPGPTPAAPTPDTRPAAVQLRSLHPRADQTSQLPERRPAAPNLYALMQDWIPNIRVESVSAAGRVTYRVALPDTVSGALAGGTHQPPLYLVDGVPVVDTDGTRLLAFSPAIIDRIEVLRARTGEPVYGPQAGRGVVAFYTKTIQDPAKNRGISRHVLAGYPTFPLPANGSAAGVLAWVPLAHTSAAGELRLPLTIPPSVRTVRITVQGLSAEGLVISHVQTMPARPDR